MAKLIYGDRISRDAKLRLGCSATIFDATRQKILLTRRSDNGLWCLPSGGAEAGESAAEACERETLEETGLVVKVIKLLGVYSDPNMIIEYADGNRFQIVGLNFEAEVLGGELVVTDETTDVKFFDLKNVNDLDLMQHHRQRITDALTGEARAFIR
jgi:ADP-ribose pyrophosphatase YjhB (NUDIX family)